MPAMACNRVDAKGTRVDQRLVDTCAELASRPGRQVMPRSPAAQSPGGILKRTIFKLVLANGSSMSSGVYS